MSKGNLELIFERCVFGVVVLLYDHFAAQMLVHWVSFVRLNTTTSVEIHELGFEHNE